MEQQHQATSTRPYFIRAVYEWCTDNGYTPYMVVKVDEHVQVPVEFVNGGEIVLNISFSSTGNMEIDNDFIRFQARFAGTPRQVIVPVTHVTAVYARENGQGMAFPPPDAENPENKAANAQKQSTAKKASSGLHLVKGEGKEEEDMPQGKENSVKKEETTTKPKVDKKDGKPSSKPTLRIVD